MDDEKILISEPRPINWLKIIKFPIALFGAAFAPMIAFIPLVSLFSSAVMLFDAVTNNNLNDGTFLGSTIGAIFLAFYISFYVPCLTIPCVIFFGIPASIVASRFNLINKWTCVFTGIFLGIVPGGLFLYNSYSSGSSFANGVHYWINGIPTMAGIVQLIGLILLAGILGAIGGFSFWYIWQIFTKHDTENSLNTNFQS